MSMLEEVLLDVLERLPDRNDQAILLQTFIANNGPLSDEAGVKVREILARRKP